MDPKVEIKGDVDVVIGQNHAPITVNNTYTVAMPEGRLEIETDGSTANHKVYFVDMSVPQLKELKAERLRWIRNAWIKIFTNPHVILFALLLTIPLITVTSFALWGQVLGNQYYVPVWGGVFMVNAYFGRKVIPGYLEFIRECKAEIAGINHALTRKKFTSK